jgi:hypothetical protein
MTSFCAAPAQVVGAVGSVHSSDCVKRDIIAAGVLLLEAGRARAVGRRARAVGRRARAVGRRARSVRKCMAGGRWWDCSRQSEGLVCWSRGQ